MLARISLPDRAIGYCQIELGYLQCYCTTVLLGLSQLRYLYSVANVFKEKVGSPARFAHFSVG